MVTEVKNVLISGAGNRKESSCVLEMLTLTRMFVTQIYMKYYQALLRKLLSSSLHVYYPSIKKWVQAFYVTKEWKLWHLI